MYRVHRYDISIEQVANKLVINKYQFSFPLLTVYWVIQSVTFVGIHSMTVNGFAIYQTRKTS